MTPDPRASRVGLAAWFAANGGDPDPALALRRTRFAWRDDLLVHRPRAAQDKKLFLVVLGRR
jgi:hypothetical protein